MKRETEGNVEMSQGRREVEKLSLSLSLSNTLDGVALIFSVTLFITVPPHTPYMIVGGRIKL